MASNQGNYDSSANVPLWAAATVSKAPTATEAARLYGNTTSGAYFAGEINGVFAVDQNESNVDGRGVTPGWVLRTTGTGGRAGRVTQETLTVVASFRSDNSADDATYQESSISIATQPASATVRANSANANAATFSVSVRNVQPQNTTVSYVWQFNTADGVLGWTNVLNGAGTQRGNTTFAGNTTATLTVTPANTSANLLVFRANVTSTPISDITGATATTVTSANAQITIM